MVSPQLLNQIADRLSRPIPAPAKPPVRTKATWKTIKLGALLKTKVQWFGRYGINQTFTYPPGTELIVTKVDTEGISLRYHYKELTSEPPHLIICELRWTNPEWQTMFTKVRKTRRKKTK